MLSRVLRNLLPFARSRKPSPQANPELAGQSFESLADAGLAHYRSGALDDAARCWRAALQIRPRDAGVLFMLGALMHHAGEEDEALELCTAAIDAPDASRHESYALMFANRGYAYAWLGDLENATPDIERSRRFMTRA
jgi:tetratricopeptide (TPR) repeat protein